ncbi:hypothetical protein NLX83_21485 [Allokutzneria sp. A3M-2-11 16]|uniref:hypothetical protein n=1 Tax=Allokutzneria sp. A3M-2-11 16 TaxID=2962043 RepID=UPI0020B6F91D|nr:hypothetical protein [Allokutzneria sp. A3M-2-11 16]MCP3801842.1 hypothetical protein [Allokutzneria sp. A3M-2-11 16]
MRLGWTVPWLAESVRGSGALSAAFRSVARGTEPLQVRQPVVVAGHDVVGLGGRRAVAVAAERVTGEHAGAALRPVRRQARASG